ncbi:MAG: ribosome silencing factor [Candidatus Omnitrophica bacterium]|nr:ribosome silencing factor [Candidatus Omnitrophota bacterium]
MRNKPFQDYGQVSEGNTDSREKSLTIARLADSKKAVDVVALDMRKVSGLCDYFVICSGSSDKMLKAISDNIREFLKKQGISPAHVEGEQEAKWILMDYGDVIVHIFHEEKRSFYNLERLWKDAKKLKLA